MRISQLDTTTARIAAISVLVILSLSVALIPLVSHAQATGLTSLSTTIRAAIMQDPRSAQLSPMQIDSMVQALTARAQSQGLTAQDIAYRSNAIGVSVPATDSVSATAIVDPCAGSAGCSMGSYIGSGVIRNPLIVALWLMSLIAAGVVWHARKNIHLFAHLEKKEVPAIGTKV